MKCTLIGASVAVLMMGISAPASACMTVDRQVTIHPVSAEKPEAGSAGLGKPYKIRYSGERSGDINKLWPNFYVVHVIDGEMKGLEVLIPAHATSCHSVQIDDGAEGYVLGTLERKDRDGNVFKRPILNTFMNGKHEKFTFLTD